MQRAKSGVAHVEASLGGHYRSVVRRICGTEIFRNTRAEMIRLGLRVAWVEEMGAAYLCLDADGSIWIWGSSHEFGVCDRDYSATLVRATGQVAGLSSRREKWEGDFPDDWWAPQLPVIHKSSASAKMRI